MDRKTLPNPSIHSSDQPIESAFSRLNLSQDFRPRHTQTPPFHVLPATLDDVAPAELSAPVPMSLAEQQRRDLLFWAQAHGNNGGGPFGFVGPHQNINVGPDALMGLSGRGPLLSGGDLRRPLNLMNNHQRQDFCGGACSNRECVSLHGKKRFSIVPSSPITNFSGLGSSNFKNSYGSRGSFDYNQQQLSIDNNMRGRNPLGNGVWNSKLQGGLNEGEIKIVLSEVLEFLTDFPKLFVCCNEDQRARIISALANKLVSICTDSYGARAIQGLLEKLINPQQILLVISAISHGAVALACDPNGQHVIQYCVEHFPEEYNKRLFNEITENCFKIATNKSGCCLLQSCLEHSRGEDKELLLSEIIANAIQIAENPYGNYVVQYLLGMRVQEVTEGLLRQFKGYFASLSCNKYASNVVEKFFLESREDHSEIIILELLSSSNAPMLLIHPFGNFVIQAALSKSKGPVRDALFHLIRINAPFMESNIYGKKILAWFEKRKLRYA